MIRHLYYQTKNVNGTRRSPWLWFPKIVQNTWIFSFTSVSIILTTYIPCWPENNIMALSLKSGLSAWQDSFKISLIFSWTDFIQLTDTFGVTRKSSNVWFTDMSELCGYNCKQKIGERQRTMVQAVKCTALGMGES